MGVKPAGNPMPQYTSYAAQAPASYAAADSAASQAPVWQQVTAVNYVTQSQSARHFAKRICMAIVQGAVVINAEPKHSFISSRHTLLDAAPGDGNAEQILLRLAAFSMSSTWIAECKLQGAAPSGGPSSGYAAQAPVQRLQVVQTPNPRRFEYAGDIAAGSPQAATAYAHQVGAVSLLCDSTGSVRSDGCTPTTALPLDACCRDTIGILSIEGWDMKEGVYR